MSHSKQDRLPILGDKGGGDFRLLIKGGITRSLVAHGGGLGYCWEVLSMELSKAALDKDKLLPVCDILAVCLLDTTIPNRFWLKETNSIPCRLLFDRWTDKALKEAKESLLGPWLPKACLFCVVEFLALHITCFSAVILPGANNTNSSLPSFCMLLL